MKHLFIVNPTAGGHDRTALVSEEAGRYFSSHGGDFEVYTTRAPMDVCSKIEQEARAGGELRVYACGGDGTLNECVCGAAERPNVAVTSFPTGTGNDFIKMFGEEKSRFHVMEELIGGEVRPIDVMLCNGRYCANICSVGVDARIGTEVHKYSHIPVIGGATGYVVSLVVNFVRGIKRPMRIRCGNQEFDGDMSLVCACNGNHYGGGFNPVPEARPDDGVMDILVVDGVSRLKFLKLVGAYAAGGYAGMPKYITHLRTQHIEIDSPEEFVINVDGEALFSNHLDLRLIPGALRFIFPAHMDYFKNSPAISAV